MVRAGLIGVALGVLGVCAGAQGTLLPQTPFVPLDLDAPGSPGAVPDRASARADWVNLTNRRMEMAGKTLRVALEEAGQTAVFLVKGVTRRWQAAPILRGKGEFAGLMQSARALGCTRVVLRNPDSGSQWAARLEPGQVRLED